LFFTSCPSLSAYLPGEGGRGSNGDRWQQPQWHRCELEKSDAGRENDNRLDLDAMCRELDRHIDIEGEWQVW